MIAKQTVHANISMQRHACIKNAVVTWLLLQGEHVRQRQERAGQGEAMPGTEVCRHGAPGKYPDVWWQLLIQLQAVVHLILLQQCRLPSLASRPQQQSNHLQQQQSMRFSITHTAPIASDWHTCCLLQTKTHCFVLLACACCLQSMCGKGNTDE